MERLTWLAWHIVALDRQKKLPSLGSLLKQRKKREQESSFDRRLIEEAQAKGLSGPWSMTEE